MVCAPASNQRPDNNITSRNIFFIVKDLKILFIKVTVKYHWKTRNNSGKLETRKLPAYTRAEVVLM